MSDKELKSTLEAMKSLRDSLTPSRQKSLDFLVNAGFVTPTGTLAENYRQRA